MCWENAFPVTKSPQSLSEKQARRAFRAINKWMRRTVSRQNFFNMCMCMFTSFLQWNETSAPAILFASPVGQPDRCSSSWSKVIKKAEQQRWIRWVVGGHLDHKAD